MAKGKEKKVYAGGPKDRKITRAEADKMAQAIWEQIQASKKQ